MIFVLLLGWGMSFSVVFEELASGGFAETLEVTEEMCERSIFSVRISRSGSTSIWVSKSL